MIHYERSYATGRSLAGLVEIVGWILVALGGLVVLAGLFGGGMVSQSMGVGDPGAMRLIGIIPGIGVATFGLAIILFAQIGRANLDTAEMTRDLLAIARSGGAGSVSGMAAANGVGRSATSRPTVGRGDGTLSPGDRV